MLGRRLGLREIVISDCESNNRGRIAEARIAMLLAWKSSWPDAEPSSKKKELMEALAKCKLNLLAHKISIKEW